MGRSPGGEGDARVLPTSDKGSRRCMTSSRVRPRKKIVAQGHGTKMSAKVSCGSPSLPCLFLLTASLRFSCVNALMNLEVRCHISVVDHARLEISSGWNTTTMGPRRVRLRSWATPTTRSWATPNTRHRRTAPRAMRGWWALLKSHEEKQREPGVQLGALRVVCQGLAACRKLCTTPYRRQSSTGIGRRTQRRRHPGRGSPYSNGQCGVRACARNNTMVTIKSVKLSMWPSVWIKSRATPEDTVG